MVHDMEMELTRQITVLVVDDHPAVRAGLTTLIDAEPGLTAIGTAEDAFAVVPAVHAQCPDVVVMDYQLPGQDGMSLSRELSRLPVPPAVLLYSAFADRDMVIPAKIARVRGVIDKATPPRELALAIRRVAAGEELLPPTDPQLLAEAAHRLSPEDLPVLSMLFDGTPVAAIGTTLACTAGDIERRIDRMLARLVVGRQAS